VAGPGGSGLLNLQTLLQQMLKQGLVLLPQQQQQLLL
jgi:hypothetical protein